MLFCTLLQRPSTDAWLPVEGRGPLPPLMSAETPQVPSLHGLSQGWTCPWPAQGLWTHGNGLFHVLLVEEGVVDSQHDPVKQGTVQRLGHGVSGSYGLWVKRCLTWGGEAAIMPGAGYGTEIQGTALIFVLVS